MCFLFKTLVGVKWKYINKHSVVLYWLFLLLCIHSNRWGSDKKSKTSSPINSSRMVLTWRAVLCRGRSIFDHCHLSWTSCCQLFGPGRCLEKYPGVCLQRVIKLSLFPAWQIEACFHLISTDSNVLRAHLPRRSCLHSCSEDSWLLFRWLSLPFPPPSVPSAVKMSAVFYLWELATWA